MSTPDEQHPADEGISPARLSAFSDGIIAIAATLLILEIHVPTAEETVWGTLRGEWPAVASYTITFLIIGVAWTHHHNLLHQVRVIDRTFLFLNLGMLLTIAFLPLPTATLGNHLAGTGATAAAVFYCASMAACSGWFALLWHHLHRRPELLHARAQWMTHHRRTRALTGPLVYLVAAGVAFLNAYIAIAISAAMIGYLIVGRRAPAAQTGTIDS